MIDFGRPFGTAWERMTLRLFRPFNLIKWLGLGFTAFLAGLLNGGTSLNFNFPTKWDFSSNGTSTGGFPHFQFDWPTVLAFGGVLLLFLFALGALVLWLGCRGQFMFLDNVLRNEAKIKAPWRKFREPANQLFGFLLVVIGISIGALLLPLIASGFYLWPDWEVRQLREFSAYYPLLAFWVAFLIVWFAFAVVFFLFREFGIPLMYHTGCTPLAAFKQVWGWFQTRPADLIVFVLVRFLLAIILLVISLLIGLLTCCVGFLPYINSVLTLPLSVFRLTYTLDCLAQFGPETNLLARLEPPALPPENLPL